jgi:hypothetical protein
LRKETLPQALKGWDNFNEIEVYQTALAPLKYLIKKILTQ